MHNFFYCWCFIKWGAHSKFFSLSLFLSVSSSLESQINKEKGSERIPTKGCLFIHRRQFVIFAFHTHKFDMLSWKLKVEILKTIKLLFIDLLGDNFFYSLYMLDFYIFWWLELMRMSVRLMWKNIVNFMNFKK